MRRLLWALLLALLLAALAAAVGSREPARTPAQPASPQVMVPGDEQAKQPAKQDVYLEHADRVRVNNRTHDVEVTGGVVLRHEEGRFFAELIRFNTRTKLGSASGSPRYQDRESEVTGERVELNFEERRAAFVGGVILVHQKLPPEPEKGKGNGKAAVSANNNGQQSSAQPPPATPQPAGDQDDDEERPFTSYQQERTVITCNRLEYLYRDKRAIAEGQIKAVQEERTAYGDRAVYDQNEETLLVTGNVRLETREGETFRCDRVLISLRDDWLEAEGNVASHLLVEDEEEGEQAAPNDKPAAPPQGKPAQP